MMPRTLLVATFLLAGCGRTDAGSGAAPPAAGRYTSPEARAEQLARFRQGLPEVTALDGGRSSRDALVADFLAAVSTRDTATLRQLVLSKAEFAWLYYPTTQQALPPYDLDPETLWLLTSERGGRGLAKALEAMGGRRLPFAGYACPGASSHEGGNTVYGPCLVRLVQAPGDTVEARLFGLVLEREGRWKFVSYTNKLD